MTAAEIIRKKRDGLANSAEEIAFLVSGALSGGIPRYQISAWLMAVFLNGMDDRETMVLTRQFVASGLVVDFEGLAAPKVDKHSTGGVGDKTSLIVAPAAAAAGLAVPMISGRGLGHTGGTLDKLEAIPGFRTDLPLADYRAAVQRNGLALIGAADQLAPADRLFYSLRDVTATVESVPLIVASILSKKAAEGIDALVLDVKTGRGAFMRNFSDSLNLAESLVKAGNLLGIRTVAVLSDMSQPLGLKVGNSLEVAECIETLQGNGPADLAELSVELTAHMILLGDLAPNLEEARLQARWQISSGGALKKFSALIAAQGGDPSVVDDPTLLAPAESVFEYPAEASGFVQAVRADLLGQAAMLLGAGRRRAEDTVDHAVGLVLHKKIGDPVEAGQPLLTLHYNGEERLREAVELLPQAYSIGAAKTAAPALVKKVVR